MKKTMKNRITAMAVLLTMLIAMCTSFATVGAASNVITEAPDVSIMIDGKLCSYQQVPIIVNGSTFLPLRALATDLGIPNDNSHIIWNQANKSVTLRNADASREVFLNIGKLVGKINGKEEKLNAAPVLYKNSTYIPVRFVADALEMTVLWDAVERRVYIKDAVEYEKIYSTYIGMSFPNRDANKDANGNINYKKVHDQKVSAEKSNVVLDSLKIESNYKINVDKNEISATEKFSGPKTSGTITYRTAGKDIYMNVEGQGDVKLDEKKSSEFLGEALEGIGIYLKSDEDEDEDKIKEEQGGLSYIERLCMFAKVEETSNEYKIILPINKVSPSDKEYDQYDVTFVIDKNTLIIKNKNFDIKYKETENGVNTIVEMHIQYIYGK